MDREMTERLEKSFYALAHRGQELVDRFYALLFARHPHLRKLFPASLLEHKDRFLDMLFRIVKGLRRPESLRQPLIDLGRRHAEYDLHAHHYAVFRDTMIEVMAHMSGHSWSDALTRDWTFAFDFVSLLMMDGQREAAGDAPRVVHEVCFSAPRSGF